MKSFAEWLIKNLKESGLTQAELSRRSGVSEGQISKIRAGETESSPRAEDLARVFKRPPSEVAPFMERPSVRKGNIPQAVTDNVRHITSRMRGARPLASLATYREIDVEGRVAAGRDNLIMGGIPGDRIYCPPELISVDGVYAVQVIGESMRPMFRPGQRVVVHPYRALIPGEGVVVQIGDEGFGEYEGILKEFVSQDEKGITVKEYRPVERTFRIPAAKVREAHLVVVTLTP